MQGCQVQEGAGAGIGREGLGNTMDDRLLRIFQSMAHLAGVAGVEDCILLFPKRPVSSKNAIVRSPPKRERTESCQISLFPESLRHRAPLSVPNFIGSLRVTPPFKCKRAVKMLRQCCRNLDHTTFQMCADVGKMLAKQTLANTCQIFRPSSGPPSHKRWCGSLRSSVYSLNCLDTVSPKRKRYIPEPPPDKSLEEAL